MQKLIVAVVASGALLLGVSTATADPLKAHDPKPDKKAIELAGTCVAAGMNAGLGSTWTAQQLADYCIEVAQRVLQADYTATP